MPESRMPVLVVGAGMYVCGRGTPGFGTVLPTLVDSQAQGEVGPIAVAATMPASAAVVDDKLAGIASRLGLRPEVTVVPRKEADEQAYLAALAELPRPACAIVCVPDHLHAPIAAHLIEVDVHVLVVKPFTPTLAEGLDLVRRASARGIYGAVDFHKRFDEANILLRQAIADERLGEVLYASVAFSQQRVVRDIFRDWVGHTNIFQYLGVHYVDLLYFLTGARPSRVLAVGQPAGAAPSDRHSVQAVIEWEPPTGPSFVSVVVTNWVDPEGSPAMSDQAITVVGTRGRYESDQMRRGVRLTTDAGVEEVNPYFTQLHPRSDRGRGVFGYGPRSIRQFLSDVSALLRDEVDRDTLVKMRPSFEAALVSTAVVEAATESLRSDGSWVTIPPLSMGAP